MKLKRLFLALTLAFLAAEAGAAPPNWPEQIRENPVVERKAAKHQSVARIVGSRPSGCPQQFCGCALALKIFGRNIRKLWLASNWLSFPRTSPRPGAVAARRGHVMELVRHVEGKRWLVFDPNSGNGRTRIHVRSLRGFAIVDPHSSQMAEAK